MANSKLVGCLSLALAFTLGATMQHWSEPVKQLGGKISETFNSVVANMYSEKIQPEYDLQRETDTLKFDFKTDKEKLTILKEYRDSKGEKSYSSIEYTIPYETAAEDVIKDKDDLKAYNRLRAIPEYMQTGEAFFISDFRNGISQLQKNVAKVKLAV